VIEREGIDWRAMSGDEIRDWVRDAGVVGLGGAVFPSHMKLKPGRQGHTETLILNGAECEPWITCDDMLMREQGDTILKGAAIMRHMLQSARILIGIEDNKPQAIAAMRAAVDRLGDGTMEVVAVPTRYPAGGAKQLIRVMTGIEVPHGKRSQDYGVQCFNVATALSIHNALDHGEPLISRIVTLTGNAERPRNFDVLIGTPIDELLPLIGVKPDTDRYIMGGPMMGFTLPGTSVPVVKATNCIIAASKALFPPPPPELPCIRCGACAEACPHELQPMDLYWFARAKNFGKTQEYSIFDCIECGCCSYVCPSNIPLVDYFRFAKSEIWARERDKDAADAARERFEFRTRREEREKEEKAARLAAKTAAGRAAVSAQPGAKDGAAATAGPPATAETDAERAKKALIAAAIERARVQKEKVTPQNTDNLTAEKRAEIAEIEARRAKVRKIAQTPPEPPE
jgi:electron transport complex protein RnfC